MGCAFFLVWYPPGELGELHAEPPRRLRGAGPRLSQRAWRPSRPQPQEPGSPRPPEGPGCSPAPEAESMELGNRPTDPSHSLSPSLPLSGLARVRQGQQVRDSSHRQDGHPQCPRRGTDGGQAVPARATRGHRGWSGSRERVGKGLYWGPRGKTRARQDGRLSGLWGPIPGGLGPALAD